MTDQITQIVLKHFPGITEDQLRLKTRKRNVIIARHTCVYFCSKYTILTQDQIAANFGYKDRTIVCHINKAISDLKDSYKSYNAIFEKIKGEILETIPIKSRPKRIKSSRKLSFWGFM